MAFLNSAGGLRSVSLKVCCCDRDGILRKWGVGGNVKFSRRVVVKAEGASDWGSTEGPGSSSGLPPNSRNLLIIPASAASGSSVLFPGQFGKTLVRDEETVKSIRTAERLPIVAQFFVDGSDKLAEVSWDSWERPWSSHKPPVGRKIVQVVHGLNLASVLTQMYY